MTYTRPEELAPQDNSTDAAADRRNVALWLVIEDEMPARRYAVTADQAWAYRNDAYDHCSGAFETPGPNAGCYYTTR